MTHLPEPQFTEQWVHHPQGRIFTRTWQTPGHEQSGHNRPCPLLLLHDSLGSVALWRDFPARLSAISGRRVIAYDRLGFGQSEVLTTPPALSFIEDEARQVFPVLLRELGLERVILLGHSVGGGMAVNMAAQWPEQVVALITESAQAFCEDQTLSGVARAREQFREAGHLERLAKYHGERARWVLDAWTESWLHPTFAPWSLAPVLPAVRCPVLALHGEHDEYGSARHPRMIAELSSGPARLELLPGAHHVPHREQAETVLRLIAEFVAPLE